MDVIEQTVRSGLSQRATERFVDYTMRYPNIKRKASERIEETLQDYRRAVIGDFDAIFESLPDGRGREELRQFLSNWFNVYFVLISGKTTYEAKVKGIGSYYMTDDKVRAQIAVNYSELGDAQQVVNANLLKSTMEEALAYLKGQNVLVTRLTEIAKQSGIAVALQDGTIYSARRDLFPTEQLYREYLGYGKRMIKHLSVNSAQAIDVNKTLEVAVETGHIKGLNTEDKDLMNLVASKVSRSIQRGLYIMTDAWTEIEDALAEEEISEVYATQR